MKHIFSCGDLGEPYKVTIDDSTMDNALFAKSVLNILPWKGQFSVPVQVIHITSGKRLYCEIVIHRYRGDIVIDGQHGSTSLIDFDTSLFTIPNIYLSREFEMFLSDNVLDLTALDMELIDTWKGYKNNFKVVF